MHTFQMNVLIQFFCLYMLRPSCAHHQADRCTYSVLWCVFHPEIKINLISAP